MINPKNLINDKLSYSQLLYNQKKTNQHNKSKNGNNPSNLNNNIVREIRLGINNNNNLDLNSFRISLLNLKNTFSIFYFEVLNNDISILNQSNINEIKGRIYFKYNNVTSYLKINSLSEPVTLDNNPLQATIFELESCKDSKGFYIKTFSKDQDFNYLFISKDGKIGFLNKDTLSFGYIFRDKREIHQFIIL